MQGVGDRWERDRSAARRCLGPAGPTPGGEVAISRDGYVSSRMHVRIFLGSFSLAPASAGCTRGLAEERGWEGWRRPPSRLADVMMTSCRLHDDVMMTSCRRRVAFMVMSRSWFSSAPESWTRARFAARWRRVCSPHRR